MIRNISQTVQEREIIKTAPDVVVFIDGLPYLINSFITDPNNPKSGTTLVNFNDHVTSFNAAYDIDNLVPNCSISLQVPNYQKYLYQMPGGNNLLQTMAQIQVYAKGYYMASTGDTVYRRVFKGVVSYIGYNDNGKTLEVSIQCQGIMHMLQLMQTNVHPSANTSTNTGSNMVVTQSKYVGNCFVVLADVFDDLLRSDMFQIGSLLLVNSQDDPFFQAVQRGYMAKWQAILTNLKKDIHIFGPYKDTVGEVQVTDKGPNYGNPDKNTQSDAVSRHLTQTEAALRADYDVYLNNIQTYRPFNNITPLDVKNSTIINRLDLVREIVGMMDYEAYQDVDGKIIIKPPLYNLDVVNVGVRTSQTQTDLNSSHNSLTNPATAIYETNNPFVVYLSEILTEQESEDQSAIRRTRTTVVGNISRDFQISYDSFISQIGEYIDVSKIAKFGLREEPVQQVPWVDEGDRITLFCHAAAETARANRGYRTYTFSIPVRPELKLGFPVYIPHKDMYGYIKNISMNYSVGGTATMTVTCDSIRRRVYVNTTQTTGNAKQTFSAYTPAPNLVYQWTQVPPDTQVPNQSPSSLQFQTNQQGLVASGAAIKGVSSSSTPSSLVGSQATLKGVTTNSDGSAATPVQLNKVYSVRSQVVASKLGNQFDTPFGSYVIKNDGMTEQGTTDLTAGKKVVANGKTVILNTNPGPGYFSTQRPADLSYILTVCGDATHHTNSVIPFTDGKGYEVVSPFPWGRYVDLNTALKTFTEQGFLPGVTDVNGQPTQDLNDLAIRLNTDAFIFAGLGTPTGLGDPSSQIITNLQQQQQLIGGNQQYVPPTSAATTAPGTPLQSTANTATSGGVQKTNSEPDATVIVLHYNPAQPGSFADNNLLNASQPENKFAEQLLANTQNSLQQTVDVLVSGEVAPPPAVQEALLVTQTQTASGKTLKLVNGKPVVQGSK